MQYDFLKFIFIKNKKNKKNGKQICSATHLILGKLQESPGWNRGRAELILLVANHLLIA